MTVDHVGLSPDDQIPYDPRYSLQRVPRIIPVPPVPYDSYGQASP